MLVDKCLCLDSGSVACEQGQERSCDRAMTEEELKEELVLLWT